MGIFDGKVADKEGEYGEEREDAFKCLPDDLILSHVVDKICDAKSLIALSLVSKEWYSRVYQSKTETISLKIPRRLIPLHDQYFTGGGQGRSCGMSMIYSVYQYLSSIELDALVHKIVKFLEKFSSMRSLNLTFDFCCQYTFENDRPEFYFRCASKVVSFLVVRRVDYLATNDGDADDHENMPHFMTREENEFFDDFKIYMRGYHISFKYFIAKLVKPLRETLEKVVVTDSENQYTLSLEESDFVKMRRDPDAKIWSDVQWENMRLWFVRRIQLPLPGLVLTTVAVCNAGVSDNPNDDADWRKVLHRIFQQ